MQNQKLRNDLRKSYDQHAQERESSTMQEWKVRERASFLSALQKANKKKLLEIGAGTGRDSKYFQDQGLEVGGYDHEGVWNSDAYIPKRFFSFFSDESLEHEVSKVFDVLTFNRVFFEADDPIHFQSLLLKKRSLQQTTG